MNNEAIELPDYQPEELSTIDKATIAQQNKTFHVDKASEIKIKKPAFKEKKKFKNTCYVINDNEYYLSPQGTTAQISQALSFQDSAIAQAFLKAPEAQSMVTKLLLPKIQKVVITSSVTTTYVTEDIN